MASNGFQFKQFYVRHDKCAMKVGTDGVLLGIMAPVDGYNSSNARILDVGTGSGLVALMIAQRCQKAQIDAIDIDSAAVEQAKENFTASPWANSLQVYQTRMQDWNPDYKYDLIVSNPPYFQNSLKNPEKGRQLARHTDTLSYNELFTHSAQLLKKDGEFVVILPAEAETEVRGLAAAERFSLTHVTHVFSKEGKSARRVLLCFAKGIENQESIVRIDSLVLEDEKGGRSLPYQTLTKDFYL